MTTHTFELHNIEREETNKTQNINIVELNLVEHTE